MASGFDFPAQQQAVDAKGVITPSWGQWFQRVQNVVQALYQSGATADRPTKLLWVGRTYFDTDLNKPVWCQDPTSSPAVWIDATGAAV